MNLFSKLVALWVVLSGFVLANQAEDNARAFLKRFEYVFLVSIRSADATEVEMTTIIGKRVGRNDSRVEYLRRKLIDRSERLKRLNVTGFLCAGTIGGPSEQNYEVFSVRSDGSIDFLRDCNLDDLLKLRQGN